MAATVHTIDAIQTLLRRGLMPVTDNRDALLELGFERTYPQVASGYEATLWERSIELDQRSRGGYRMLARQRAVLELATRPGAAEGGRRERGPLASRAVPRPATLSRDRDPLG
jgi:hypothetical protein